MRRTALALTVLLLLAASAAALRAGGTPHADARMVLAEVFLGETLLLRGSTSDDGKPDVDAVWDYLRGLDLQPTEAFAELKAARAGSAKPADGDHPEGSWTLRREPDEPWIRLRIAYGGRLEAHWLTFVPAADGAWRVAAADVESYADMRWIRRWEATRMYRDD